MKILKNALMFLAVIVLLAGCKKELGVATFDVDSQSTFTIQGGGGILNLLEIVTPGVQTNWEGDFANNNTNKDQLREMHLTDLTLTITNPAGQTFDFLENIHIFIKADGLQETEIAYKENIPTTIGQTLKLDAKDIDLTQYAKKDAFTLRVTAKQRKTISQDVTMRADMIFKVTADVLK
ncbi:MAG: hypothetical protein EOP53_13945 [Sphingobacteriales bacterium]|nr:MAG: hypothetical protein EOP53_13945 [Sphingobacteriales bacterium]